MRSSRGWQACASGSAAAPEGHAARAAVVVQLRAALPPGTPGRVTGRLPGAGPVRAPGEDVELVAVSGYEPGDRLDGWELVAAPGHADGQLCLLKGRVLVSADHLLGRISPTVGLWPASRPDPLGDFLESLERTIELAPEVALPGHGDPIEDPVGRARELIAHHQERLAFTEATLTDVPRSGYEVSLDLFGADLKPASRRFAVAETLSHLERLVLEERAERAEDVGIVAYTARQLGRAV